MKFYSHTDKLILTHLKEVNNMAQKNIDKEYSKVIEVMSFSHDFGKYTSYFQNYLFGDDKNKNDLNGHGFISALFGAFIALNLFGSNNVYPLMVYNSVLHHHGSLKNISLYLPGSFASINNPLLQDKIGTALEQLKDMESNKDYIICDYEKLGYGEFCRKFIEEKPVSDILFKLKKASVKFDIKNKESGAYFISQMLYSALISADKISAANIKIPDIKFADFKTLEKAKINKFKDCSKDKMSIMRNEIFYNVQKEIENCFDKNRIFSITAPTGTGKTYCGFFAALKLRELLKDKRRIIYALPFTSIINQNYSSICSLYKDLNNFKKESSEYIIKHHSLSNVEYSSEYENYNKTQAEMLIENWNSGIIVTTFVQLLETLISNKNRMLKKFNALKGSIILLDEVQAIDIKLLKLTEFMLYAASRYLDCRIIMMTATKPLILTDSKELLKDSRSYFDSFNRNRIIPIIDPVTIDEFIDEFYSNIEDKSYLIICNTISQSLKIYNEIKNCGRKVLYLSTNILPKYRRERIEEVNRLLKNGEKVILVSTQVVEAGVDFDFDIVIRDIAPFDSIIQSAGRCNRNGLKSTGNVYVYCMVDERGETYGSKVYGRTLISISKSILEGKKYIEEKEYFDLIQSYFEEVNKNINQDTSAKFEKSIIKLYFNKSTDDGYSIDKFSLIKKNSNYMDVFFRIDDEAENIYKKLLKALSTKDADIKNERILEIKNKMYDYILSIPLKYAERLNNKDDIVLNLPESACEVYYDEMTGYKREKDDDFFVM